MFRTLAREDAIEMLVEMIFKRGAWEEGGWELK
jgi:hypothetical protein